MAGYIPKKIAIYHKGQPTQHKTPTGTELHLIPASMADPERADEVTKAKNAVGSRGKWDYKLGRYVEVEGAKPIQIKVIDNRPCKGLRLISLGEDIMKVATQDNFVLPISNDQIDDIIWGAGIEAGGHLAGEYLIARLPYGGYQFIRIGSSIYESLSGEIKHRKKRVSNKDLEVGGMYSNEYGAQIFLGWISTTKFKTNSGRYSYGKRTQPDVASKKELKRAQLWWEPPYRYGAKKWSNTECQKEFDKFLKSNDEKDHMQMSYRLKVIQAHSVTKKLGNNINVPDDILELISTNVKKEIIAAGERDRGYHGSSSWHGSARTGPTDAEKRINRLNAMFGYSSDDELVNMGKAGTEPIDNLDELYINALKDMGKFTMLKPLTQPKAKAKPKVDDVEILAAKLVEEVEVHATA